MSPVAPGVGSHAAGGAGSMRTLNTLDSPIPDVKYTSMDMAIYFGFWALRIFIAAICFGWMTLKSMPKIVANSNDAVRFWRFKKQAESDLLKVGYTIAFHHLYHIHEYCLLFELFVFFFFF